MFLCRLFVPFIYQPRRPRASPSGPAQPLFQGPPAKSKFLAASFGEVARRSQDGPEVPDYKPLYMPKERVVAEALMALANNRARVYPGLRTALAAAVLAALPVLAIRFAMSFRPRRAGGSGSWSERPFPLVRSLLVADSAEIGDELAGGEFPLGRVRR